MKRQIKITIFIASLLASRADAVDSFFLNGISFFDTGDLHDTTIDLETADLSPGYDGDFLLTFGNRDQSVYMAGFGYFWSRRSGNYDIPFEANKPDPRVQIFAFPFTAGWAKRVPSGDGSRSWLFGILAHYYFAKMSVENPDLTDPAWFRLGSGTEGERDAEGPGISLFCAREVRFFLGRIGLGVKGRWTSLSVDEISGLGTPDVQLTGVTLFLSVMLSAD